MKTDIISLFRKGGRSAAAAGLALACALLQPCAADAMAASPETSARPSWQAAPRPLDEENPQAALVQAGKRFQQAEAAFAAAENEEAKSALNPGRGNSVQGAVSSSPASSAQPAASASPGAASGQSPAAKPAAPTTGQPSVQSTYPSQAADPRAQALQGSPETGYSGTWTDPANGDIITSVIAPTPQPTYGQSQNYPIIIEPQVSEWGSSNWNSGSSDSTGWQSDWPQWEGYPGNPGYPVPPMPGSHPWHRPQPSVRPMPIPPGAPPNYPEPPFPPGYRPLRPGTPHGIWMPGDGGYPGAPVSPYPPSPGANPPPMQPPYNGGQFQMPPGVPNIPGYNSPPWATNQPLGYNPLKPWLYPQPPASNGPGNKPAPPTGGQFPTGPANPGLQPPGPLPNGPAPGFQQPSMRPSGMGWQGASRPGGGFGHRHGGGF